VEECFILYFTHARMVQVADIHESALLAEVNVTAHVSRVTT
jgi:hypothetical protein